VIFMFFICSLRDRAVKRPTRFTHIQHRRENAGGNAPPDAFGRS